MDKQTILSKIEDIAENSVNLEVKLNALKFLIEHKEMEEREERQKRESTEFKSKLAKQLQTMTNDFT